MNKTCILFDLDGTVLDSKPGVFHSISYALNAMSLPMPHEEVLMGFLGPPITMGFEKICNVPKERVEEAVRLYREYYNNGGKFEAEIFGGMRELLINLRKNQFSCCVTTSKPEIFAKQILAHYDMDCLFDGIYGSGLDGARDSKAEVIAYCLEQQSITSKDCILVGDRYFDVDGAKAFDMPCIGVLFGYGSKEELEQAGAIYLADTPNDVLKYVLTL